MHKLVCEGTVEERIGVIIDDKRKLADSVVGTGEAWLSELSTDELRDLVVLEMDSCSRPRSPSVPTIPDASPPR